MGKVTCGRGDSDTRMLRKISCRLILLSTGHGRLTAEGKQAGSFNSFTARFMLPTTYLGNVFDVQAGRARSAIAFEMRRCGQPAFRVTFAPISRTCQLNSGIILGKGIGAFGNVVIRSIPLTCAIAHQGPEPNC